MVPPRIMASVKDYLSAKPMPLLLSLTVLQMYANPNLCSFIPERDLKTPKIKMSVLRNRSNKDCKVNALAYWADLTNNLLTLYKMMLVEVNSECVQVSYADWLL